MNPDKLPFEEYLKLKRVTHYGVPVITIAGGSTQGYVNVEACELMGVYKHDKFAAAPNPDADEPEFFICKTTHGEGWAVSTWDGRSGATFSTGLIRKLGDEFDCKRTYELEETGMTHPDWETPIFLATPYDDE